MAEDEETGDYRLAAITEELAAAIERYRVIKQAEGFSAGDDDVSEEEVAMLLQQVMIGGPPAESGDQSSMEYQDEKNDGLVMPADEEKYTYRSPPHQSKSHVDSRVGPQSLSFENRQYGQRHPNPPPPLDPPARSIRSSFRDRVRIVFYDTVRARGADQSAEAGNNSAGPVPVDGLNESPQRTCSDGSFHSHHHTAPKSNTPFAPSMHGDSSFITLRVELIFITNPNREDLVRFDAMLNHSSNKHQRPRNSPSDSVLSSLLPQPILYVNIASSREGQYCGSRGGEGAFSEEEHYSGTEFQVIFSNAVFLAPSPPLNSKLGGQGRGSCQGGDGDADSYEAKVHSLIDALGGGGVGQKDDTMTADALLPILFIPPERNNTIGAGGTAHLFYPQEVVETSRGRSKQIIVVNHHKGGGGSGSGDGTTTTIEEVKTVITTTRQNIGSVVGGFGSSPTARHHHANAPAVVESSSSSSSSAYTRRQETITQRSVTVGGARVKGFATGGTQQAGRDAAAAAAAVAATTTVRRVFPMASLLGRIGTMGLVGVTSTAAANGFPQNGDSLEAIGHRRAGGFTPLKLLLMDHHRSQEMLPMGYDGDAIVNMMGGRPHLTTTAVLPFAAAEEDSLAPLNLHAGGASGTAEGGAAVVGHRQLPLLLSHMDGLLGDRKGLSPSRSVSATHYSGVVGDGIFSPGHRHGDFAGAVEGGALVGIPANSSDDSAVSSQRNVGAKAIGSRSGGGGGGVGNDPRDVMELMQTMLMSAATDDRKGRDWCEEQGRSSTPKQLNDQLHDSGKERTQQHATGMVPHSFHESFLIADSREPLAMRVNARSRAVVHGIANVALVMAAATAL